MKKDKLLEMNSIAIIYIVELLFLFTGIIIIAMIFKNILYNGILGITLIILSMLIGYKKDKLLKQIKNANNKKKKNR